MIFGQKFGSLALRVCLFGGEIGRMENFGEKIGRKFFLECVWLGGGAQVFSLLAHKKVFSPRWRKNCEEETYEINFQKYP